jgi:hypothetical protein
VSEVVGEGVVIPRAAVVAGLMYGRSALNSGNAVCAQPVTLGAKSRSRREVHRAERQENAIDECANDHRYDSSTRLTDDARLPGDVPSFGELRARQGQNLSRCRLLACIAFSFRGIIPSRSEAAR